MSELITLYKIINISYSLSDKDEYAKILTGEYVFTETGSVQPLNAYTASARCMDTVFEDPGSSMVIP